ncbi:MAG TPA: hypothetical protein PLC15_21680 [Candidatus Obscuribacter sp.]|nr:hypothetical protein [Candidatus Obscuribacter sp.]HNB18012.1 hypothetical protein [Candidatus Obscuribacter sp.]HND05936.1 hypothetical protein [Candidatus Obscuribacter sp.]HNG74678.1 hypothetical protein [Candidatus Obscuribacter sp.]
MNIEETPTGANTGMEIEHPRGVKLVTNPHDTLNAGYGQTTLEKLRRMLDKPSATHASSGHNLNCLEIIVRQGELAARQNWNIYCHALRAEVNATGEHKSFTAAVHLLDTVNRFLQTERTLFVEALSQQNGNRGVVLRITAHAQNVEERLEELVMMHVDEPDGAFTRGIVRLLRSFDELIEVMHESLSRMSAAELSYLDGRYLCALMGQRS